MTKLGLVDKFNSNPAFYLWLKMVMSLPLLPKERIVEMWNELKEENVPDMRSAAFRVSLKHLINKVILIHGFANHFRSSKSMWTQLG